jgi:hypothetical protein
VTQQLSRHSLPLFTQTMPARAVSVLASVLRGSSTPRPAHPGTTATRSGA